MHTPEVCHCCTQAPPEVCDLPGPGPAREMVSTTHSAGLRKESRGDERRRQGKQKQKKAAPSSQCGQRGPLARDWSAGSIQHDHSCWGCLVWCMGYASSSMQDHGSPDWQVACRSACNAPASLALGSGTTRRKSTLIRKLKAPHICRKKCKISLMITAKQHQPSALQEKRLAW